MPDFDVKGTDVHGEAADRRVTGGSAQSVVEELRRSGVQVSKLSAPRARRLFEPRGVRLDEFAFFNRELAGAVKRGVPLPGTIRALSRDLRGARVRAALDEVASELEEGMDLGEALARQGHVFPPGYVTLVSAGLRSGNLAGTLRVFADEARLTSRLRGKLASAVAYPLVVLFAASGLLAVYWWSIVPMFEQIFRSMGTELPGVTLLHLACAQLFKWTPVVVIALAIALPLLWKAICLSAEGARSMSALKLRLPVFGGFFRAVVMARFSRTVAGAVRSGAPLPEAVTLAGLSSGNAAVRWAARRMRGDVEDGATLSDAMAPHMGLFPATLVWMVHIAEQRGEMAEAFEEYAGLMDERAERAGETIPVFASAVLVVLAGSVLIEGIFALVLPFVPLM
ncbi:MAG: type II secretion system F family protein [Planctomycetota bacterium]